MFDTDDRPVRSPQPDLAIAALLPCAAVSLALILPLPVLGAFEIARGASNLSYGILALSVVMGIAGIAFSGLAYQRLREGRPRTSEGRPASELTRD